MGLLNALVGRIRGIKAGAGGGLGIVLLGKGK